jgi:hypothetical protein
MRFSWLAVSTAGFSKHSLKPLQTMSTVVTATAKSRVFFQDGDDNYGPEQAIVVTPYDNVLLLEQSAERIEISRADLPAFIKLLQLINKESNDRP